MATKKPSPLVALTASALALPGLHVQADTPPTETALSYRFSNYQEDDAPAEKVQEGDVQRYGIDVHQFRLVTPILDRMGLTLDYVQEAMSGASPWDTTADSDGEPLLIMSGATIEDTRQDVAAELRIYDQDSSVAVNFGYSDEDDYSAISGGLDNELQFNQKNTTVKFGMGFSLDTLRPSDAEELDRVAEEDKTSATYFVSLSQVLSQVQVARAGIGFTQLSGYLTDPYKADDARPDTRNQVAASLGYRHFLTSVNAALQLDYRYYSDDWDVNSHTLDFGWYQNVGSHFQIIPAVRYYSQGQAEFYGPYPIEDDDSEYFSSDYRLSNFGAISYKLKLVAKLDSWAIMIAGERYESAGSYSFKDADHENPGLVSFTRWTVGFDKKF